MKDHLKRLLAARREIAGLETCKCRLRHEKAWRDPDTGMPQPQPGTGGIRRVTLCDADLRRKRLSCAHTASWQKVVDAIGVLTATDTETDTRRNALLTEYNGLLDGIMTCDHGKGEQDKQLALIQLEAGKQNWSEDELTQRQAPVAARIRDLVNTHDRVVDRLESFRLALVAKLDDDIRALAPEGIEG